MKNTFRVVQGFASSSEFAALLRDVSEIPRRLQVFRFKQRDILDRDQSRVILAESKAATLLNRSTRKLGDVADVVAGFYTGDNLRFVNAAG